MLLIFTLAVLWFCPALWSCIWRSRFERRFCTWHRSVSFDSYSGNFSTLCFLILIADFLALLSSKWPFPALGDRFYCSGVYCQGFVWRVVTLVDLDPEFESGLIFSAVSSCFFGLSCVWFKPTNRFKYVWVFAFSGVLLVPSRFRAVPSPERSETET